MTTRRRAGFNSLCALVLVMALPAGAAAGQPGPATLQVRSDGSRYRLQFGNGPAFREAVSQLRGAHLIEVPGTPTRLILWQEILPDGRYASFYAISLDGQSVACVRRTSYVLKLRYGEFDPLESVPPVEAGFEADADARLFLVQFVTQPLEVFRRQIEELGGTVNQFVANHAHIVRMSPDVREAVTALPYVRWVGPLHPAYRLEGFLLDNAARGDELFPEQCHNIMLVNPEPQEREAVAQRITAIGGQDVLADVSRIMVRATLTPAQLFEVIRWDEVLCVDRWLPGGLDMDIAREIGGADFIENTLGFTGQGVRGEMMDDGYLATHKDFESHPAIMHTTWPLTPNWHGTCTMGVLFGDGSSNPQARGLLPDAQPIWAAFWPFVQGGANRYTHTAELVDPFGPYRAVFQCNSWGQARTTEYTSVSAEMDDILFIYDILVTNSLGNAGDHNGRQEAWAKNIVAVGGVVHRNTLTQDDDCWNYDPPTPPPGVYQCAT